MSDASDHPGRSRRHERREVLLSVTGLAKTYRGDRGDRAAVEALRDVTFDLRRGELACLVGPSGSGKTTLLTCIAGLLEPTAGQITLDGSPVTGPSRSMAVVFQDYGRSLFPWYRVRDNVGLPLKSAGVASADRERRVDEALAAVGLAQAADRYPWQLSGGMQQRAAIARAIAYEPDILLMDEPFAAVDAQTRADLEDLVRDLWHRLGVTVLFITHDIDEAVYLGERVIVLSNTPAVVQDDIEIDLPDDRDQLSTRAEPRFLELRGQIYAQIRIASGSQRSTGPGAG